MKKMKLISRLSALSIVGAATPLVATACNNSDSSNSKINSITLSKNSVLTNETVAIYVSAKCEGSIASVKATSKDTSKLKIDQSGTNYFVAQGVAAANDVEVEVKVTDTANNSATTNFLFNVVGAKDTTVTWIDINTEQSSVFAPVSYDNVVSTPVGKIDFTLYNAEEETVQKDVTFTVDETNKPNWMSEVYIDTDGSIYVSRSGTVPGTINIWTTTWTAKVDSVETEPYEISFMYVPNFDQNGFIVWEDDAPNYKIYHLTSAPTQQVTQAQINAFASQTGTVTVKTEEGGNSTVIKKENIVTIGIQNTVANATIPEKFCVHFPNLCYVDLKGFETHITKIPDHFFYDCPSLQEIYLNFPAVTTIGQFFLGNCKSLTEVDFSKMTAVKTIGNACLYQCDALETIDISGFSNLQEISGVFAQYVPNLTKVKFGSITLDKMNKQLPAYSLTCREATDKSFVEGIKLEGTYASEFLKYLTKIELPASNLFRYCYI